MTRALDVATAASSIGLQSASSKRIRLKNNIFDWPTNIEGGLPIRAQQPTAHTARMLLAMLASS
jgi:hypothetical protein